ncbi:MAG: hypothetical protein WCG25_04075 [bacterium]
MSKHELVVLANSLLSGAGYDSDGTRRKSSSQKQREFEKHMFIKTPMGGQTKK